MSDNWVYLRSAAGKLPLLLLYIGKSCSFCFILVTFLIVLYYSDTSSWIDLLLSTSVECPCYYSWNLLFQIVLYSFGIVWSDVFFNGNKLCVQSCAGKCDLFTGDWVPNTSGPAYNESCPIIENPQNCIRNGRPDTGYLYWRWNPRDCEIPKFDPERFLEMMRNKAWALIGDSISRNHVQSLLCMLSTVFVRTAISHINAAFG